MKEFKKLPLADRLRRASSGQAEPRFLHVYRLYLEAYFSGLSQLAGDGSLFTSAFQKILEPYAAECEDAPLLVAFVAESKDLPLTERTELLYQVLVWPFAEIQRRRDAKCSLPF